MTPIYSDITQEYEGTTNAAVGTTTFRRMSQGSKGETSLATTSSGINDLQASSATDDTGTIVGVTIVIVILVVVVVVGALWLLRRRKRGNVGPNKDRGRPGTGRESGARTTWHELETTSNRSSGISNTIDYCVEEVELEMQPEGRLSMIGLSMFDDKDSLDEDVDPVTLHRTESTGENGDQSDISDTYDVPKHHSPKEERNIPINAKQTDNKDTVTYDNNANSFSIKESIKDEADPSLSDTKRRDVNTEQSDVGLANPSANELAKVITEERTLQEEKHCTIEIVSVPADEAISDQEEVDVYENVLINQDDVYVNHATVEHDKPAQTLIDKETTQTSKDQKDFSLNPKPVETRPHKAPVPQPRMSIRNDSSHTDTADVNKDNEENETATVNPCPVKREEYVDYDPTNCEDSVNLDYDSVDRIYDVPKNNRKEIDDD